MATLDRADLADTKGSPFVYSLTSSRRQPIAGRGRPFISHFH